ncbi:ABC transporter substrate-binding protein [Metabacillus schmidteae]|uniref:ABC transporter substrate-binding protein n=1 Tax=Metabacillus schmidteae TaxID=2730405 RepID=UPI00158ABFE2|nr:sugar ABC transporter substrate-binding protein [Metabacillus schmidteae]
MRKTRFPKLFTVIGLIFMMLVAGCSNQSSGSGGSDSDSSDTITLKVLSPTVVESPEGDVEKQIAEDFMKENPNIKIEFIGVPMNEIYTKLTTMATGGEVPDIFINSPEFYGKAHEMGIVEDLTPLLGEEYINGFYPATLDEAMIDGKLQYAPWFTIPTGLLYRKDWFEEEGLNPPKTWDEFLTAAKTLTGDTNGDGEVDRWGFAMVGTNNGSGGSRFIPIMRTFGAEELTSENGEWTTGYDSKEAIDAFSFFSELVTEHEVVPPGPLQTGYPEAVSLMASEKAAMMVTGPHSIGSILNQNPELEGKIAGVPLPHEEGQTHKAVLGMLGFSISATSEHKDAAVKYLKFLLNKKNQLAWNEKTGRIPARMEAGNDPAVSTPELQGFIEALDYAFPLPNTPYYPSVQLASAEAYQAIISGTMTAEEAAKNAAEKVRREIENNK